MRFRWILTGLLVLACAHSAGAQGWEFGVLGGEVLSQTRDMQEPSGGKLQVASGYAAGLHFDHTLWYSRIAVPHLEVEFTVLPPRDVRSASAAVPQSYDALYLTPGLRLEFLPRALLRPWVAGGGGYTLYIQNRVLTNGQTYSIRFVNTAAVDFGGGLDCRLWRSKGYAWSLNVRGQVRDFVSGNPSLNAPLTSSVQHNIVASGGLIFGHQSAVE